jgi:hypothetical protein
VTERKKLSDILQQGSDRERLAKLWKTTAAAAEFAPLPRGDYTFRILSGEGFTAKSGTHGYKLTLEVAEGEFGGRRTWHDFWFTPDALPYTKRDLAKIGLAADTLEDMVRQLDRPLPPGILIRGKLVLKTRDNGDQYNELKHFQCIGIEKGDAFAPTADAAAPDATEVEPTNGDGSQNRNGKAELFAFGANVTAESGPYGEGR